MKKYMNKLLLAMVSMAAVACSDDAKNKMEDTPVLTDEITFSATLSGLENGVTDSRTGLIDGVKVEWTSGDRISVLYGNANKEFTTASGGTSVTFTGKADEMPEYYALYPYHEDAVLSGRQITTLLRSVQKPVKDGFDNNLSVMISRTTSEKKAFAFKNICALLRFELKETGVKSVTLQGNNHEMLAGTFIVEEDEDGDPMVRNSIDGVTSVTLENGGNVLEKGIYNFVTLPAVFTQGVTLTLLMENGTKLIKEFPEFTEATLSNYIYDLGQIKVLWELAVEKEDCYTDMIVCDEAGNTLNPDGECYRVGTACTVKYKIASGKTPCSRGAFVVEGAASKDLKVTEKDGYFCCELNGIDSDINLKIKNKAPDVLDFYFKDNTYSEYLTGDKKDCSGVIFRVGIGEGDNVSDYDGKLSEIHGYVIAADPEDTQLGSGSASWCTENYRKELIGTHERPDAWCGYANTKKIIDYAKSKGIVLADDNYTHIYRATKYSSRTAPEGTSGWYLGSKVQMEAVAEAYDIKIAERLQECSDAELWRRRDGHWRHFGTSTERDVVSEKGYYGIYDIEDKAAAREGYKDYGQYATPVLTF